MKFSVGVFISLLGHILDHPADWGRFLVKAVESDSGTQARQRSGCHDGGAGTAFEISFRKDRKTC